MGRIRANLHCESFEVLARAEKQRPSWCILDDTTDNSCDCALYLFHACPIILDLGGHTNCKMSEVKMVGTTGFEPATSRTPSVRATRLRYVPTGKLTATGQGNQKAESGEGISTSKVSPPFEQRQESSQRIAQIQQHLAAQKLRGPFRRRIDASALHFNSAIVLAEMPPRAGD